MYLSKFTRKQSKIKPSKSQKQTTRKQRIKQSMTSRLLPKESNKTESKSASETTIDSIISNITKQDISDDEKIQMICEKLSHLETINFYGVLTLPYIKSKVSKGEYDGGQTLGGAKKRETDAQLLDKLDSVEKIDKELTKIDRDINTINENKDKNENKIEEKKTSADEIAKKIIDPKTKPKDKTALEKVAATTKQAIQSLESKTYDYKKELSSLEKTRQALIDKKETLINDATARADRETERRRRTAAELAQTAWRSRRARRETEILTRCLENYQQQRTEFINLLAQIKVNKERFMYQISSIDSHFGPMASNIINKIGTKLENINKTNYNNRLLDYKIGRQRMPQYRNLERKLVDSTDAVDRCKRRIRRLRAAIPPRVFTEAERINLTCDNQFIITPPDCDKVFFLVQTGRITKDSGIEILDVWLENTRRMIELEKELFSKGYKGSTYLADYVIYREEFDKIDSIELEKKLNDAFEASQAMGERAEHTIVKAKFLSDVRSGFMCFFYSEIDKNAAKIRASADQRQGNFHLTVHLDKGVGNEALAVRNVNMYSSGSIHLRAADGMNMYKANMRPYIFEKDTDQPPIDEFIGSPRCIQILPVYPGDAIETSEVIYVGRIVTHTLNTYLKKLAINSEMPIKEAEHNFNFREKTYLPIITGLETELPKQVKLVKKQKYSAEIEIFEATLATIKADLLQKIEVFRGDDECKIFFERMIKGPYEETLKETTEELTRKKDKFKDDENGMDPAILVEIARQGVRLEDFFPAEIFPEGGHINLTDIAAIAAAEAAAAAAAAEGKYKRKKYTRKRLNKVSKKRRYKILRNRTNKQAIYKIKSKINKNKQK